MPDSPIWLLSKGRKEEALKALRWLRGWVPEDKVKAEFEELCQYTQMSNRPTLADDIHVEYPANGKNRSHSTRLASSLESR